jgi:hypothetical protein
MVSKFDLAAIFAAMACLALSIENRHHFLTDAPGSAEQWAPKAAAPCPDNDSRPYPANCLEFMEGKIASEMRRPVAAQRSATVPPSAVKRIELISSEVACPDRDDVPYSASCLAFMTGWYWRPNELEVPTGAVRP